MPSKLPDLLGAGVPVLAICDEDSEVVALLRRAGDDCGAYVGGFESPDLPSRLDALLERVGRESRPQRIARLLPLVRELFGVENVARSILDA